MHLRTVHARELPVPAAEAGALLDSLGGPGDRLWPNDTWPASALRLEQPLRVGSRGGHGAIRLGDGNGRASRLSAGGATRGVPCRHSSTTALRRTFARFRASGQGGSDRLPGQPNRDAPCRTPGRSVTGRGWGLERLLPGGDDRADDE
jgi:hypothetical protein